METRPFYIGEKDFRIWLPDVEFVEKSEDAYNSRQIAGIMTTQRKDRQGETMVAKGLYFDDFLKSGHFNDNHSQETSAIVGYPESVEFHKDLSRHGIQSSGWTVKGYLLKGTRRADAIWELAKALASVPNRKLGFSVEGKVIRRENKTIEKAHIRNVAITNCPVNTDCTWEVLAKSMDSEEDAMKSLSVAGTASPLASGGSVLAKESLDRKLKNVAGQEECCDADGCSRKKCEKALKSILQFDDMVKSMEWVLEKRPDFTDEAAAIFVNHLFRKGF